MITALDWLVLALYVSIVVVLGVWAGRKEKTADDYFLAGRKMPWWAVMLSISATTASALTFIGVPGAAFGGDFNYLQLAFGDLAGRLLIAWLLLTAYYKDRVTTVYELLGRRFGPISRGTGTAFFLLTRLLASGIRLAGCAIALSVVFNLSLNLAIVAIALFAVAYTVVGGIKAVIWTDTLQFILFVGGAIIVLFFIWSLLPGGFDQFVLAGMQAGKFEVFHIALDPNHSDYIFNFSNPQSLFAGFILGCLTTFAVLGTDQDLVQRMLTCERVKESQKALVWTAVLNFPMTLIFLSVGAALFVYYGQFPDSTVDAFVAAKRNDYIFPHFIKSVLMPGMRGLMVAALLAAAMSSLDSALNALSSSAYIDIYKNHINPRTEEKDAVRISRIFVVIFATLLAGIAMVFGHTESILWLGFKAAGYTYGAMLGIFLLAVLTKRRGNDVANAVVMVSSVGIVYGVTAYANVAWSWSLAIGALWTLIVASFFRSKVRNG